MIRYSKYYVKMKLNLSATAFEISLLLRYTKGK